uniref:FZ domain-containing protein n=1 Tax=Romanomermis culicivorax TaxID=13658 RepID=A0A915IL61_ROMCU
MHIEEGRVVFRSVCLKVQFDCMPLFNKVSMSWPESLNCTKFPEAGRGTLCMDPDSISSPSTESSPTSGAASSPSTHVGHKFNVNFNVNNIQSAIKSLSVNSAKNKQQNQKINNNNDNENGNPKGQSSLQAVSKSFEYCARRVLSTVKTGSSSSTKGEANMALWGKNGSIYVVREIMEENFNDDENNIFRQCRTVTDHSDDEEMLLNDAQKDSAAQKMVVLNPLAI